MRSVTVRILCCISGPSRRAARLAAPSVSNSGRGAVALRSSMPELSQLRLSWRGSYAPSHGGRAMNPLETSPDGGYG